MTEEKTATEKLTVEQRLEIAEQGIKNLEAALISHQHLQNGQCIVLGKHK